MMDSKDNSRLSTGSLQGLPFNELTLDRSGNGPYRLLRGVKDLLVRRFEKAVQDPETAQRQLLGRILEGAQGTVFSKDHGLQGVRDLESFRARVPIAGYSALSPYILRIAAGEDRILTRAPVRQFLETSGTTGAHKWIPVTDAWAKGVSGAQTLWVLGLIREHQEMAEGSALTLVSPAVHGHTACGLPYGSNTGRMHLAQPWWVRIRYPIPYEAYLIQEPEARIYTILRFALQADIRSITTANPTTVLLLFRKLEQYREQLSMDLAEGSLRHGPAAWIPERQRRILQRSLKRRSPPASWNPRDIWKLASVNCWQGGSAAWFLPRIRELLGPDLPLREVGISASEGFIATSLSERWGDSAVAWPLGEFLEFVDSAERPHCLWELEQGGVYRVVLSGTHGMYRYDLADLVEVVGFYRKTPVLRFLRRAGQVLNVTGEKVTEEHVLLAMRRLCRESGIEVGGFTLRVQMADIPSYELAFEPHLAAMESGSQDRLSAIFDRALIEGNVEYEAKRDNGRLGPARISALPQGTYARLREAAVAAGTPEGQYKDPIMALDDRLWERIMKAASR